MERREKAPQSPGPEDPGELKAGAVGLISHIKNNSGIVAIFQLGGRNPWIAFSWLDYQPLFGVH